MTDLSAFSMPRQWPALQPDRLQLYSLPTPNGVKVTILLEETGLPHEVHQVSFETHDQRSPAFVATVANNKIPAILDPGGPSGQPLALFESGAILLYLAESRRLLKVLKQRLTSRAWVVGDDSTIADIAILPWVRTLIER